jgi:hypothetical protein
MKKNLHNNKNRCKLKCFLPNLNFMKILNKHLVCILLITGLLQNLDAQYRPAPSAGLPNPQLPTPTVPTPQVPTLEGMVNEQRQRVQQQNNAVMQGDMMQYNQQHQQNQALIDEATREMLQREIQYELPDRTTLPEAQRFLKAYDDINDMLEGKEDLSLKKAVFEAENAWYGGVMNYEYFCSDIAAMVDIIKTAIQQQGHSIDNDLAKKWMLHRFISDTLRLKDDKGNVTFTHLPYEYDFDDIGGQEDWSKMFVTKLMRTRKGQCRSMPLLYLILAEELGVKAWLSYSPSHTYIRLQDDKKTWFNLELTNGHYSASSWILSSGFIKSEALKNDLYMDTLSKKELIAGTLNELGKGYTKKFGYDRYVHLCAETTLKHHSNNIFAMQMKADWATIRFRNVWLQLNRPPKNQMHLYPKANQVLQEMYDIYKYVDQTGYEQMPEERYKEWLRSFDKEKGKQPIQIIRP